MSRDSVRAFLAAHAPDLAIVDQGASTATVADAAATLDVVPGRIAKTLALRLGDQVALIVTRGDARLDNRKTKAAFGVRPRLLGHEETAMLTGHPVGGVCPFGLATPLPVYCDVSLRDFASVWPAAGSTTSSVNLTPARIAALTGAIWVDVCQQPHAPLTATLPTLPTGEASPRE